MKLQKIYAVLFQGMLLGSLCVFATAQPVQATRNVSSSSVQEGLTRLEFRNGYEFDDRASRDHRLTQQFYVDHGVSEQLAVRATANFTQLNHDSHHLAALRGEVRWEWLDQKNDGLGLATRLRYHHNKLGKQADQISMAALADKRYENWLMLGNATLLRDVGSRANEGVALQLASQVTYVLNDELRFGAEWFANVGYLADLHGFSAQEHQLGPVIDYKITPSTEVELGYLQGVSSGASDGMLKLFIRSDF